MSKSESFYKPASSGLLESIRACTLCQDKLSHGPRPVLNFSSESRILIAGQAPGRKVHYTGVPWNDASGDRLRAWLGVEKAEFYNPKLFAIVPMAFCYPGKGKSGDLPPRRECATKWMVPVLETLKSLELKILIGCYAQKHFLKDQALGVTELVKNWKAFAPEFVSLPHPSPRNNIWLKKNPWFEQELVPQLQKIVRDLLS